MSRTKYYSRVNLSRLPLQITVHRDNIMHERSKKFPLTFFYISFTIHYPLRSEINPLEINLIWYTLIFIHHQSWLKQIRMHICQQPQT